KALNSAQRHQQHRSPPANRGKGGQNSDQRGGNAHHPDGEHQHTFPAKAVTEVAENYPAQRTKQKTDAEGGKRSKRAHGGADLGKEFTVKDQRSGNTVEQKVIPVDDGACEAT